jgi:flagellar hook-associated protein 3 FlgL
MITRSTYGTFRLVTETMQKAAVNLQEAQLDAATLDRLRNPSDHPMDAAESLRLQADLDEHYALADRLLSVNNELATVDGVLADASSLMVAAKELAVAMESETASATDRETAAEEINSIFASMVTVANTHYNGIYLFAGTSVDTKPFLSDGTYQGGTDGRSIPLMGSDTMTISYTGEEIFSVSGESPFDALADLETALLANDSDGISDAMEKLDAAYGHVVSMRGTYGVAYSRAEELTYASEEAAAALEGFVGTLTEMDMVDAFSQLAQAQTVYESAATTLTAVLGTNIFKYL